ncbi:putative phosphohydrolase [Xenococcus sp. PCC 7305]|uniref:metallophosphoesterase family protein n=1 Tax=Xenococcus sp. PCC 7305 TaxID=102125 RepID=UPI0002AD068E|nr:metallophosphoesterase [Xenococcus sp. PCC 7305]ELS02224.1 putative phosphohydrolase [Xenococcus sp. PCC 7305]
MNLDFRFGVISDPHIALPQTISNNGKKRFHLVEVSISALEQALEHLESLDLDFLLLPGDLTQNGEPANHQWLVERLARLPFPAYVIPGNHDVPSLLATESAIAIADFPEYYQQFGYQNSSQLYYSREILPGVQLIGLNSNLFDSEGTQLGFLDAEQLEWLESCLANLRDKLVLVAVHHNVIEHLPGQSRHPLGQRYMLGNSQELLSILKKYQVQLLFTGHLHVQDIAQSDDIYEICTGSLVSYPHPYRIIRVSNQDAEDLSVKIESHQITSVPGWPDLATTSREFLGDRSDKFMMSLLTCSPLNLDPQEAVKYVPQLRYFWADIAQGDTIFDFPEFPDQLQEYFSAFGAIDDQGRSQLIDNQVNLTIN